ncbi:MAG: efflux RND transporter periplasmic adaptor subunit [Granulosicoccaceae bacterium]
MRNFTFLLVAQAFLSAVLSFSAIAAEQSLDSAVVESREVADVRRFDGVVEAINSATVSAETSGRIVSIDFDVDDYVEAGEVILRFSDIEHKAQLAQAVASLDAATATRQGAADEFKRIEKLVATGAVAKSQFDRTKASLDNAKGRQNTAAAAVEQAREQLAYTIVRAPYSGLVKARHVELGELASRGQPLMTGFSLDELRVSLSVPQQFARLIREVNQALIVNHAGDTIQSDQLTVFPFADGRTNTVTVRVDLPSGVSSVFPGMLVKAAFNVGTIRALMVPESAIVRRGEVRGVYLVADDGRLALQQVRTGRLEAGFVEVVSGLVAGDVITLDAIKAALVRHSQFKKPDE